MVVNDLISKDEIKIILFILLLNILMIIYVNTPLDSAVFHTDLHGYVHEEVMWWHWLLWNFINNFLPLILLFEFITFIFYLFPPKKHLFCKGVGN